MSDKVFNSNISAPGFDVQIRGQGTQGVDSDYRTLDDNPQHTFYGNVVPPNLNEPDNEPPLLDAITPLPGTFPWGLIPWDPSNFYIDIVLTEEIINWDINENWALGGAAGASGAVYISSILPLVGDYTYRLYLSGWFDTEGLFEVTMNPCLDEGAPCFNPDATSLIQDLSGNNFPLTTWDYWIDLTVPKILSVTPPQEQVLYFDVNFNRSIVVEFSEFLGNLGQSESPGVNPDRYTLNYFDDNGNPIASQQPHSVTVENSDGYSYGEYDGTLTVRLHFNAHNAEQATKSLSLVVNDVDQLQDRAGNDLLADTLIYNWQVGAQDTTGPDWTSVDPGPECPTVQQPVEWFDALGDPIIYDGMRWVEVSFNEPINDEDGTGPIYDSANWIIEGVPNSNGNGTQAYEVESVTLVSGGETPVYRALLKTTGTTVVSDPGGEA